MDFIEGIPLKYKYTYDDKYKLLYKCSLKVITNKTTLKVSQKVLTL